MKSCLQAAWVAPMDVPIIRDGAVAYEDGRILAVGKARDIISAHPDVEVEDLGDAVLLPGLVNAHTHLELSNCECGDAPGGSFGDWLLSLPRRIGRTTGKPDGELFFPAVHRGVEDCLRFGVTCVGDISQQMHLSRPVLRAARIRSVSYGEVIGLSKRRNRFEELLPQAIDRSLQNDRLHIGLTPHSPYTVDADGFRQCLRIAREQGLPLATHLAEHPDETPFLESNTGIFRDIWEQLGMWGGGVPTFAGGPIRFAEHIGLLDHPTLLAHVNYCDDDEMNLLAHGQASVVYCPRTHAYFGHPPHRWRVMLVRGINVAVGTDSCASSPDLNLVEELRLLRRIAPEIDATEIWRMATTRAAKALTLDQEVGSITPGKHADLVAFTALSNDPLEEILQTTSRPSLVVIGGQRLA